MKNSLAAWCLAAATILFIASAHAYRGFDAKTNYTLYCQGCHGADGVGALPKGVPPLSNSMGYFLHVPDGRRYLVQVPGSAYSPISDAQVAEVLNYALQRFSPGQLPASFRPYSADEVARVRRSPEDIVSLRARLVTAVREGSGVCIWTVDNPVQSARCEGADGPVN